MYTILRIPVYPYGIPEYVTAKFKFKFKFSTSGRYGSLVAFKTAVLNLNLEDRRYYS
eukprot:SAG31_NODE_6082_length_2179_cov_19.632692_2_plen_57_part_00